MNIQQNAWVVGSVSSEGRNGPSYQPPGQRLPRKPAAAPPLPEEEGVTLTTQRSYHGQSSLTGSGVDESVSFNQTQEAFLDKIQTALEQMSGLSAPPDTASVAGESFVLNRGQQFSALQKEVQNLRSKMSQSAEAFHAAWPAAEATPVLSASEPPLLLAARDFEQGLAKLADPATITGGEQSASEAHRSVEHALTSVRTLRSEVEANLRRFEIDRDQTRSLESGEASNPSNAIKDQGGAEQKTQAASFKMVAQSRAAMLAQANAVPQSALRLLS